MGHRHLRPRYYPIKTLISFPFDFPEHNYQPIKSLEEEYWLRVELGRLRAKKISLSILGCARDIEDKFERTKYTIESIGGLFKNYSVFIFESDSLDRTPQLLQEWTRENRRVQYSSKKLSLPRLQDCSRARMEVMAAVRNQYLDFAQENEEADYYCVVDMDLRGPVSLDGILNSFGYTELWDIITANGLDGIESYYYDMLPLYTIDFTESSLMVEQKPGAPYANIKQEYTRPKFNRGEPLQRVCSAFGGMAFYVAGAILSGARYTSEMCDHATLHHKLQEMGYYRLYINPSLLLIR